MPDNRKDSLQYQDVVYSRKLYLSFRSTQHIKDEQNYRNYQDNMQQSADSYLQNNASQPQHE